MTKIERNIRFHIQKLFLTGINLYDIRDICKNKYPKHKNKIVGIMQDVGISIGEEKRNE